MRYKSFRKINDVIVLDTSATTIASTLLSAVSAYTAYRFDIFAAYVASGLILYVLLSVFMVLIFIILLNFAWYRSAINLLRSRLADLSEEYSHCVGRTAGLHSCEERSLVADGYNSADIPDNCFEFYMSYRRLEVDTLANILRCIDNLYSVYIFVERVHIDSNYPNEYYVSPSDVVEFAKRYLRKFPQDRMFVHYAQTGDSIKFHMTSGLKFELKNIDGEASIGLPPSVVIFGMIIGFLTILFQSGTGNIESYYRMLNEINKYNKEVDGNSEYVVPGFVHDFFRKLKSSPYDISEAFDDAVNEFASFTIENDEIKGVEIAFSKTVENMFYVDSEGRNG